VASLLIIGILLGLLVQMSISTLTYANITTNSQTIYDSDPINYELNFNAASKLMFAVGVVVG
jgi:hypothetical protein